MAKGKSKSTGNTVDPGAAANTAADPAAIERDPSAEQLGDQPADSATPIPPAEAEDQGANPDDVAPEAPTASAADADQEAALWIRSVKPEGFRRCGFRFGPEGVGIALSALTEEQIETLSNDPCLVAEPTWMGGEVTA